MYIFKLYQGAGAGERLSRSYEREDPCFFKIIELHWGTRNSIQASHWRCQLNHQQHSESTRVYRYGAESQLWKIVREQRV